MMKNLVQKYIALSLFALLIFSVYPQSPSEKGATSDVVYDLVIKDGRVMDPETMLDAILNVGLKDGRIYKNSIN